MRSKLLGNLSFFTLIVTILWLIFLIIDHAEAGALETYEQVLAHVSNLNSLYYLSYLNAGIITLAVTLFFAALYDYLKGYASMLSVMGLVFVPVYTMLNLLVYISQVAVVPKLLALQVQPETASLAGLLLKGVIQQWPESGAAFFNNLAYAILGVPSIIYDLILYNRGGGLRWGGILLALNGLACILGVVGLLLGNQMLGNGSLVGGVLFMLAMIPFSMILIREK